MNGRMLGELFRYVLNALRQRAFLGEEQTVGAAQIMDLIAAEAAPPQADDVEAGEVRPVPEHHPVGDDIVLHAGQPADEGVRSDADELVNAGPAADDGEIADLAVAREHGVVGQDHVVADAAIVRHMRLRQEKAAVADDGFPVPLRCPCSWSRLRG